MRTVVRSGPVPLSMARMRGWSLTREARELLDSAIAGANRVEVIRGVAELRLPAAIPMLTAFLDLDDPPLSAEVLAAIRTLLQATPRSQLRRLDREVRSFWPYWGGDFPTFKPADVKRLGRRTRNHFTAAVICSMHRSGYVREEAVRRLASHESGAELPYLLVRAADWVDQVRDVAQEAVRARMSLEYLPMFVESLVLVEGESFVAGRASTLLQRLADLLAQPEAAGHLLEALETPDRPTRRSATRWYARAGHEPLASLLERALHQDDVVVATLAAEVAVERLQGPDLLNTLDELSRHRVGRLRQLALWQLASRFPEVAADRMAAAVFDPQAGVRQIAQRHLVVQGIDVAARYRAALQKRPRLSLLGLSEVGSKQDASLAVAYLASVEAGVRRAAAKAIASLDPEGHVEHLLKALGDPGAGVSREARKGLERLAGRVAERVWTLAEQTSHEHVRANSFRLMRQLSKWDALRYGLMAVLYADQDIRDHGARLIELCLAHWNLSFVEPTDRQIDQVFNLLDRSANELERSVFDELTFAVKSFRPRHP